MENFKIKIEYELSIPQDESERLNTIFECNDDIYKLKYIFSDNSIIKRKSIKNYTNIKSSKSYPNNKKNNFGCNLCIRPWFGLNKIKYKPGWIFSNPYWVKCSCNVEKIKQNKFKVTEFIPDNLSDYEVDDIILNILREVGLTEEGRGISRSKLYGLIYEYNISKNLFNDRLYFLAAQGEIIVSGVTRSQRFAGGSKELVEMARKNCEIQNHVIIEFDIDDYKNNYDGAENSVYEKNTLYPVDTNYDEDLDM